MIIINKKWFLLIFILKFKYKFQNKSKILYKYKKIVNIKMFNNKKKIANFILTIILFIKFSKYLTIKKKAIAHNCFLNELA